jgi:hypothetical protein
VWLFILVASVLLALFCFWQWKFPPRAVIEMASGIVPTDPEVLAAAAGVDLDIYTLARIGQSEEGMSSDRAKVAVMCAAMNHSRALGRSITSIATAGNPKRSDYAAANGRYGRQGIHPYCTTIADPKPHTIELAGQVYNSELEDETDGSRWWDNPIAQLKAYLKDPFDALTGLGTRSPDEIAERREKDGRTMVTIPGVSTRFWK